MGTPWSALLADDPVDRLLRSDDPAARWLTLTGVHRMLAHQDDEGRVHLPRVRAPRRDPGVGSAAV